MTITLQFRDDMYNLQAGLSTPNMAITHVVFSRKAGTPGEEETLTTDNREFEDGRIVPTISRSTDGKTMNFAVSVAPDKCVCDTFTISTVVSITQLTISDASEMAVGDLIGIEELDGYKPNVITAISTNTITLQRAVNTNNTKHVRVMIGRVALVYAGNSSRLNGKVYKWMKYELFKNADTKTFSLPISFDLKG